MYIKAREERERAREKERESIFFFTSSLSFAGCNEMFAVLLVQLGFVVRFANIQYMCAYYIRVRVCFVIVVPVYSVQCKLFSHVAGIFMGY